MCWQALGSEEDVEGGGEHGENNETAAEVDSTEHHLRNPHSCLNYQVLRLLRLRQRLMLLHNLFLAKRRALDGVELAWAGARHLHRTLQRRSGSHGHLDDLGVSVVGDVTETNI